MVEKAQAILFNDEKSDKVFIKEVLLLCKQIPDELRNKEFKLKNLDVPQTETPKNSSQDRNKSQEVTIPGTLKILTGNKPEVYLC